MIKKVTFLAFNHAIGTSIIAPMDLFGQAAALSKEILGIDSKFELELVTIDGKPITCSNSLLLTPHKSIQEVQDTDLIIITSIAPEAIDELIELHPELIQWLQSQYEKGVHLCSVCGGAFILAETGLLNGKTATTHWGLADRFQNRYPEVTLKPERLITDEGTLFCSGGALSTIDMTFYLISKYFGQEVAFRCSKTMVYGEVRASQLPYTIFEGQKNHDDDAILKVQEWLEQNYYEEIQIDHLSTNYGMTSRTFKRRFKKATGDTPLVYLQRIRIDQARQNLDRKGKSIEEVCYQVGYKNPRFFRDLFKKYTGLSPREYRKKSNYALVN